MPVSTREAISMEAKLAGSEGFIATVSKACVKR